MIRSLARVIGADPGKPTRPGAASVQRASRAIALDPSIWSPEMARDTVDTYAELAATWTAERGGYRRTPLADALARGGPWQAGPCLEIGSGTGVLTSQLCAVWSFVVSLDLSEDMLRMSDSPVRVRADGSRMPIADGVASAVVLADVPLFATEVARVLAPHGVVIWSNALGTDAPHHVPVDVVLAALEASTSDRSWTGVTAEAGWGLWAVYRREPPPDT